MFVWMKSDGRGTSVGCCGGIFFLPMALASLLLGLGCDWRAVATVTTRERDR